MDEFIVQLISLIYIFILSCVYFLKRKYNFLESKIYKYLLILTNIFLVLDILCIKVLRSIIFYKIYFCCIMMWVILFIAYVILNRSNHKYSTFREMFKNSWFGRTFVINSIILIGLVIISPVNVTRSNFNYTGPGIYLIYGFTLFSTIVLSLMMLFNSKKSSDQINYPVILSVGMLALTIFLKIYFVSDYILGCGLTLITLFLYFTLENPDIKYVSELNALKVKSEQANEAKTYFLASMSHEIRTPMNAIIGLSESLLGENLTSGVYDDVKSINRAANTLLEIVNNILDITKIEEGKTKVNYKEYNLGDVIAEIKNIANVLISEKPIKFETYIVGQIPKSLMGDEVKLYQIMQNLISNACKYTNKGTITLYVESKVSGNKDFLTFRVIDTGIGIKKSDMDKIFTKFERLDQEQKTIQGTGLGLVITKQYVEMLGGKISFSSEYQKGTTFVVELEQEIVNKEVIEDVAMIKAKKTTVDSHFNGSNFNILLVDDNLLNLKVAEKLLKPYGFNITTAKSGLECINYTKNKKYDLVFLDHMMPEMDGIQTLYNLKSRASGFDTPVVVLTANAIEGSRDMYLKEGFCDYLSKPINQVELDRILKEQLNIEKND